MDQLEILTHSQLQLITLFLGGAQYVAPFTTHRKLHEFGAEKPIS